MRIAYLLGTPFSGSTAIGSVLTTGGAHYVGEVDRLPFFSGNKFPLLKGYCLRCQLRGVECRIYSDQNVESLRGLGAGSHLYERIAELSGAEFLVDGSKHANWLRTSLAALAPDDRNKVRAVLCVRNPFQFCVSFMGADPNEKAFRVGEIWRDTYIDLVRTLYSRSVPFLIVRNEDFASSHKRSMSAIADFLDVEVAVAPSYQLSDAHSIGGNPVLHRQMSQTNEIRIRETKPMLGGVPPTTVAQLLNVPGLFGLANDVFGYPLHSIAI